MRTVPDVPCTGTLVVSILAVTSMTSQPTHQPDLPELQARLPELFVQLLAEMSFADAWALGSPEEIQIALGASTVACCVPFTGDLAGVVALAADPATLTDLAAGFHSLPDEMVDDGTRLEFLAEAGALLVRELALDSGKGLHLVPGAPRLPTVGEIALSWRRDGVLKAGFGCNGDGWMIALVRFDA